MNKTAEEIEEDVFLALQKSELKNIIGGGIYYTETRPINSKNEDAVIAFLAGTDSQIQRGVVCVNVYVKNINNETSSSVKHKKRCKEISRLLADFQQSNRILNEYYIELDSIIKSFKSDDTDEHFVNCRLKFKRITF